MLNTQCYECAKDTNEVIDELGISKMDIVDRVYMGNGKFRCPRCGHILNAESNTYHTIFSIDFEGNLSIIKTTVPRNNLDAFIEDLQCEQDLYHTIPKEPGVYDAEIYCHYYHCGGYEYPDEWDCEIIFFKLQPIELPLVYEKIGRNLKNKRWRY